jgi:hypothetical protein
VAASAANKLLRFRDLQTLAYASPIDGNYMAKRLKYASRSFGICTSCLWFFLFAAGTLQAQTVPTELNIIVVQGEGSINKVRQAATSDPVVRIEDQNHKPIAGATVTFTLPTEGATGHFGNGGKMLLVSTDAQGKATAEGLKVNEYPGKLAIHVDVTYRGLSARTNITQFDEGPPVPEKASSGGHHGKLITILVIAGAAAGGGAYFATHRNGASSPGSGSTPSGPAAIGLTPGSPTITGPH